LIKGLYWESTVGKIKTYSINRESSSYLKMFFLCILVFTSIIIALIGCEIFLQYQQKLVKEHSIDRGILIYHELYGSKLAPGWEGRHIHNDFNVEYKINSHGFRGEFELLNKNRGKIVAFVGDSFTFGQGVKYEDTFVQQLNIFDEKGKRYLNFAVPGFSTDQEYLLIKHQVINYKPDTIVMVTYLGNDLFDNQLRFPLQANHAKSYFELSGKDLTLKNTPVPKIVKPDGQGVIDLKNVGLTAAGMDIDNTFIKLIKRYEFYKLVANVFYEKPDESSEIRSEFKKALSLYMALLKKTNKLCIENHVELILILMPGKPYVEKASARNALYQEVFRKNILEKCSQQQIKAIDLAAYLRQYYKLHKTTLFFPKEGHLNKKGNQITADFLQGKL